jgi:acylphosphatase
VQRTRCAEPRRVYTSAFDIPIGRVRSPRAGKNHDGLCIRHFVPELVHWHCVARGRVQGVNYRARVAEAAHRHGVVGTVANRPDGTVFIDVQGPGEAVEAFVQDVNGPRGVSHANAVERVAEAAALSVLVGFEILRD